MKIYTVPNLGDTGWQDLSLAFSGCTNPTTFHGGELGGVTTIEGIFKDAINVVPDVSDWDTSSITSMAGAFQNARAANPAVSDWDTASVTTAAEMFNGASIAVPDVSGWDTSSLANASAMFEDAPFANPDMSLWNVEALENAAFMLKSATSAEPNFENWFPVNLTDAEGMLSGTDIGVQSYSTLLIQLAENNTRGGVELDGGAAQYHPEGAQAKRVLEARNWTITDGGANFYSTEDAFAAYDSIFPTRPYPRPWEQCVRYPSFAVNADWDNSKPATNFGYEAFSTQEADAGYAAPWMTGWESIASHGPDDQSWTLFERVIEGDGEYYLKIFFDDCGWAFLDGELIAHQTSIDQSLAEREYRVELSGTHTLQFLLFDFGGRAGFNFILEPNLGEPFIDSDGDGLFDEDEMLWGSSPTNPDSDGDGINDGNEVALGSNVNSSDSDGDGIDDATEIANETSPVPLCGNGQLELGEDCDDNNDVDNDACPNDCIGVTNVYGAQKNVTGPNLRGWEICHQDLYNTTDTELSDVQANCSRDFLMLGCRPKDSETWTLLAMGGRETVFETSNNQTGYTAFNFGNGLGWYYDTSKSFGFVEAELKSSTTTVNRSSCDTASDSAEKRLCWHTSGGGSMADTDAGPP